MLIIDDQDNLLLMKSISLNGTDKSAPSPSCYHNLMDKYLPSNYGTYPLNSLHYFTERYSIFINKIDVDSVVHNNMKHLLSPQVVMSNNNLTRSNEMLDLRDITIDKILNTVYAHSSNNPVIFVKVDFNKISYEISNPGPLDTDDHEHNLLHNIFNILYPYSTCKMYSDSKYKDLVLLISGYNSVDSGHMITFSIKKLDDNSYEIILTNSGGGTEYHKFKNIDDTIKCQTVVIFNVKSIEIIRKLHFFTIMFNTIFYSNSSYFYKLLNTFVGLDPLQSDNDSNYNKPQLSGSCTYYSLYYLTSYHLGGYSNKFIKFCSEYDRRIINKYIIGRYINRSTPIPIHFKNISNVINKGKKEDLIINNYFLESIEEYHGSLFRNLDITLHNPYTSKSFTLKNKSIEYNLSGKNLQKNEIKDPRTLLIIILTLIEQTLKIDRSFGFIKAIFVYCSLLIRSFKRYSNYILKNETDFISFIKYATKIGVTLSHKIYNFINEEKSLIPLFIQIFGELIKNILILVILVNEHNIYNNKMAFERVILPLETQDIIRPLLLKYFNAGVVNTATIDEINMIMNYDYLLLRKIKVNISETSYDIQTKHIIKNINLEEKYINDILNFVLLFNFQGYGNNIVGINLNSDYRASLTLFDSRDNKGYMSLQYDYVIPSRSELAFFLATNNKDTDLLDLQNLNQEIKTIGGNEGEIIFKDFDNSLSSSTYLQISDECINQFGFNSSIQICTEMYYTGINFTNPSDKQIHNIEKILHNMEIFVDDVIYYAMYILIKYNLFDKIKDKKLVVENVENKIRAKKNGNYNFDTYNVIYHILTEKINKIQIIFSEKVDTFLNILDEQYYYIFMEQYLIKNMDNTFIIDTIYRGLNNAHFIDKVKKAFGDDTVLLDIISISNNFYIGTNKESYVLVDTYYESIIKGMSNHIIVLDTITSEPSLLNIHTKDKFPIFVDGNINSIYLMINDEVMFYSGDTVVNYNFCPLLNKIHIIDNSNTQIYLNKNKSLICLNFPFIKVADNNSSSLKLLVYKNMNYRIEVFGLKYLIVNDVIVDGMYSRWVYSMNSSFLVRDDKNKLRIMLVNSEQNILDTYLSTCNTFTNPSKVKDIIIKHSKNIGLCTFIEFSRFGLYLIFNDPQTYFMYLTDAMICGNDDCVITLLRMYKNYFNIDDIKKEYPIIYYIYNRLIEVGGNSIYSHYIKFLVDPKQNNVLEYINRDEYKKDNTWDNYSSDVTIEYDFPLLKQLSQKVRSVLKNNDSDKREVLDLLEFENDINHYVENFMDKYDNCGLDIIELDLSNFISSIDDYDINYTNIYKSYVDSNGSIFETIVKNIDIIYKDIEKNIILSFITSISEKNVCYQIKKLYELINVDTLFTKLERPIEVVLFETIFGSLIRNDQYELYNSIYNNMTGSTDPKSIYHMLMGKGKTSIITPLLCIKLFYSGITDITLMLPSHLIKQSNKDLLKYILILNETHIHKYTNLNNGIVLNNDQQQIFRTIFIVEPSVIKRQILNGECLKYKKNIMNRALLIDEFDMLYNPLKSEYNKPLEKSILKNYDPFGDNLEKYIDSIINGFKRDTIINTGILQLDKVIDFCVSNNAYNYTYGFPRGDSHNNTIYAVPYEAVNKPSTGSYFSQLIHNITFTTLAYLNRGILTKDNFVHIETILRTFSGVKKIAINYNLSRLLKDVFGPLVDPKHYNLALNYHDSFSDIAYRNYMRRCEDRKYKRKSVNWYIKKILIPSIYYAKSQLNCSFIDIINNDIYKVKCGFTGTQNIVLPGIQEWKIQKYEFNKVLENKVDIGSIYYSFLHGQTKLNFINKTNILESISSSIREGKYDCLIDTGAFLREYSSYVVVMQIIELIGTKYDYFIYITSDDEKHIYDCANRKIIKFDEKIYLLKNTFIYYDNQHTVGIDIKQNFIMKGLVTVNTTNRYTEVAQGMYRLRHLNYGHTVDFILDDAITGCKDRLDLLKRLLNKDKMYMKSMNNKLKGQLCKYYYRKEHNYQVYSYKEDITNNINFFTPATWNKEISNKQIKKYCKYLDKTNMVSDTEIKYEVEIEVEIEVESEIETEVEIEAATEESLEPHYLLARIVNIPIKIANFYIISCKIGYNLKSDADAWASNSDIADFTMLNIHIHPSIFSNSILSYNNSKLEALVSIYDSRIIRNEAIGYIKYVEENNDNYIIMDSNTALSLENLINKNKFSNISFYYNTIINDTDILREIIVCIIANFNLSFRQFLIILRDATTDIFEALSQIKEIFNLSDQNKRYIKYLTSINPMVKNIDRLQNLHTDIITKNQKISDLFVASSEEIINMVTNEVKNFMQTQYNH